MSLVGGELFEKIKNKSDIEAAEFSRVIVVKGSATAVVGMIRAVIYINNFRTEIKLNILPQFNHEVLLGRDFRNKHVRDINFLDKKVMFRDWNTACYRQPKVNAGKRPQNWVRRSI